ncbi:SWIM zinc finger family protein [Streptomyces sp. NPDC058739]|uniref:SWIM zinc finger family protein n=1 Tax=Streptomyces sp. NPDC058739 TaxID=3346618 RepID=UPI0036C7552E
MTDERPADEARRALRAALRRATPDPDTEQPPAGPRQAAPARPEDGRPRPGDAARAALRAARAAHRTEEAARRDAEQTGGNPEQDDRHPEQDDTAPAPTVAAPGPGPGPAAEPRPSASTVASPASPASPEKDPLPEPSARTPAPPTAETPASAAKNRLREALAAHRQSRATGETAPPPKTLTRTPPPKAPAGAPTRKAPTATPAPEAAPPAAHLAHPAPRTMATPHRDGDLRRTFPALAPTTGAAAFATTWWGNAWVTALEEGALDAKRLARGRGYAEQGHVDAITVTPGLVLAYVQGSRPRPYRVQVRLRTLDDSDWERFLDTAAERPAHIAALLDKELPPALAEGGTPLLPGPGDLAPQCSCPDRGHPCKHAAALCYQTARLLDADPFVLLLLRGRGERTLLDALSRRNAARAARAAREREPAALPAVRASEVLARRERPPLPDPLPVPAHPEQPPAYPAAPGGPDPLALDQLATDAAARAHALLATGHDPVAELTLWQDAVRLAAARPGSGLTAGTRALYASLAAAAGRTPAELARAVAAWRQGGPDGLAVLEEPWDPPAGRFDRARPLLLAADLPAFRPTHNRLTHPGGHVQLRLGRDGLWYAYESEPGADDWWPRGTPDHDPVGALTGLGTASGL